MLEVRSLKAGYKRPVVEASFKVERGEVFVLAGPNASGKSTLLKCIAGMLKPFSGEILLDGRPLRPSEVAFVPADERPKVSLSIIEFAALGRAAGRLGWRASKEDLEKAYEYLEVLDIAHLAERSLAEVSTGQRQLAYLAQALAREPEVLLLDEPTSALDLKYQVRAMKVVLEYVRRGKVAVVVHHDINLASEFSSKVGFLKDGTLVAQGPPNEVITKELLERVYEIPVEVLEVRGRKKVLPVIDL